MLSEVLTLGDKIDIKPLDKNGNMLHNPRTFVSQLVDFVDFDIVNIAAPIVYSKAILLRVGDYYNLCFYTNKGLFQCKCIVLNNFKDNNTIISVVRIISNLEKYQRRQFYRLECIHDIEYRIISIEEEILERKLKVNEFRNEQERENCQNKLEQLPKEWIKAAMIDVSGGGARFNSSVQHKQGDKLQMKLSIVISSVTKKMLLGADIISSSPIPNRIEVFEHRIGFNDIHPKDREELIKYIFEQERRLRKNGKIL